MEQELTAQLSTNQAKPEIKTRYCLYARKSTESDEKQVLSLDSQVKEMLQIAELFIKPKMLTEIKEIVG